MINSKHSVPEWAGDVASDERLTASDQASWPQLRSKGRQESGSDGGFIDIVK